MILKHFKRFAVLRRERLGVFHREPVDRRPLTVSLKRRRKTSAGRKNTPMIIDDYADYEALPSAGLPDGSEAEDDVFRS